MERLMRELQQRWCELKCAETVGSKEEVERALRDFASMEPTTPYDAKFSMDVALDRLDEDDDRALSTKDKNVIDILRSVRRFLDRMAQSLVA